MEPSKTESLTETRLREIHSLVTDPKWDHVRELFRRKVAEYRDISGLADVPPEDLKRTLDLNLNVAATLDAILAEIENTAEQHDMQVTDQPRIYRSDDFV